MTGAPLTTVTGLNNGSGKAITGAEHLAQSIGDILTTPIGSRVMKRDYGSRLHDLLGQPINAGLQADITSAVADALGQWEPRFALRKITLIAATEGHMKFQVEGDYLGAALVIPIEMGGAP